MSTTILARNDQGLVTPRTRVRPEVRATPDAPRPPRETRRAVRRLRRRADASTNLNPRVIDLQIRSVALWPRSYR